MDVSDRGLPPKLTCIQEVKGPKLVKGSGPEVQDYEKLREQCLSENKLFEDPQFPCNNSSLALDFDEQIHEEITWKRPPALSRNPKFIVNGISRFDIKQGSLGDCWFLSTLASLTLHPELFERVVPLHQSFEQEYAGIFHFRFWHYGQWVDVVVDDRLPVLPDRRLAFLYSSETNEYWISLLEKAYAKLNGSYGALSGGFPDEAMVDLTGGVVEKFVLPHASPNFIFNKIRTSFLMPTIIACGILWDSEELAERGLVAGHAYSITAAISLNLEEATHNLIRVRNPWGNDIEWNGPWSDGSPEWQKIPKSKKQEIGLRDDEDGEFWMPFDDFFKFFNIIEICHYSPSQDLDRKWKETILEGEWLKGISAGGNRCRKNQNTYHTNPQFRITLSSENEKQTVVIISLLQKNRRMERKPYLSIGFDIFQCRNTSIKTKLGKDFLWTNRPLSEELFQHFRQGCAVFYLMPKAYCIVPYNVECDEAEFVLRILTKIDVSIKATGSKIVTQNNNAKGEKIFNEISSKDKEIDWQELQLALRTQFGPSETTCCFDFLKCGRNINDDAPDEFQEPLCRSLLTAYDRNYSGKLSHEEFQFLWKDVKRWQATFNRYKDSRTNRLTPQKLVSAMNSVGVVLPEQRFQSLLWSSKMISFDDSLIYALRLETQPIVRMMRTTAL